jgi:hypothetical protein
VVVSCRIPEKNAHVDIDLPPGVEYAFDDTGLKGKRVKLDMNKE